ncbi:MAG: phosphoglucomutase/phosphomannomutase family protein [Bacillota bacterium]
MLKIKFGTDGWRAVMAEDFTFDNVRLVTQAISGYLINKKDTGRGVVIGYDNRFLSEKFALAVGEIFTGNGISVLLAEGATPTPVIAFAVKEYGAAGAVMITASHNPPEYNGLKFIPDYAGPALPHITEAIEIELKRVINSGGVARLTLNEAEQRGLVRHISPKEAYLDHLRQVVDLSAIKKAGLRVVIDPLYGAGIGYLNELLADGGCIDTIHDHRDPLFGGVLPEPMEPILTGLAQKVQATGAQLGLAMDGDADRFGVVDHLGKFISANQVLPLVLEHLIRTRRWEGTVARSVATTHMLDTIARHHGMEVIETPVGFKYIGQALMEKNSILGGEESGGMSIRGHLPEKDGILACALVAELAAKAGGSLGLAQKELRRSYGSVTSRRLDLHVTPEIKQKVLERLLEYNPARLVGAGVVHRTTIDGLKIVLEDSSWALIRPSGTEPLFRLYTEAQGPAQMAMLEKQFRQDLGL